MTIGRFHLRGSHITDPLPPGTIALHIDAAAAFGTGDHESTAACLRALDQLDRSGVCRPRHVLDMGTGTGILGIAAAKLHSCPVLAVDIDQRSVEIAAENAALNHVSRLITTEAGAGYRTPAVARAGRFDLIFANILARPLIGMAPRAIRALAPGGHLILAGILTRWAPAVLRAHAHPSMRVVSHTRDGAWSSIVLRKRDAHRHERI